MKLVSISTTLLDKYQNDPEVLTKSGRLYVLVVRLKYKGHSQDFAIPIRSNIPASAPKSQYFALPPRPSREWQPGVSFEFHTSISQNHSPKVFFCRISPPPLHRSISPLPLCSDTDLPFFCCAWEVHTFPIWQVRGDGGFGKFQSVCS